MGKRAVGEILKKLRKGKGYRQNEIAELLHIPVSTYGGYERNVSEPCYDTLIQLAELYDVNLDYLLGRVEIRTSWRDMSTELHTSQGKMNLDVFLESVRNLSPQNQTELLKYLVFLTSANQDTKKD